MNARKSNEKEIPLGQNVQDNVGEIMDKRETGDPLETKHCSKCDKDLPLKDFYKSSKKDGALRGHCRKCVSAETRANYRKDPEKRKAYALNRIREHHAFVRAWKAERGCSRCPEKDVVCLDIHHIDPATKRYTVSHMVTSGKSLRLIREELEKCVTLCRNCHAKEHLRYDPGQHKGASSKPKSKPGPKKKEDHK